MLIVLAHPGDVLARRVIEAGAASGDDVVPLTASDLTNAGWVHRRENGSTATRLSFADRPPIDLAEASGVLSRLHMVPTTPFSSAADREYGVMEFHALAVSALAGLECPVVNAPCGQSLAGVVRSPLEWLCLAARLGLPIRRVRASNAGCESDDRLARTPLESLTSVGAHAEVPTLHPSVPTGRRPVAQVEPVRPLRRIAVVGAQVMGAPSPDWQQWASLLANASGCSLLTIDLAARADGSTVMSGADSFPEDLPDEGVVALVSLLDGSGAAGRGAVERVEGWAGR